MARNWFIAASLLSLGCSAASRAPTETAGGSSDNEGCPAGTRWLATDPHVPLAVSKKGELLEVGDGRCCAAFAARGQRWQAVDGWGRIVGVAETAAGGERNYATECHELDLEVLEGGPGAVYATPDFGGSPSFAWTPSPMEQGSLRELVAHADALLVADDGEPPHEWTERVRFFSAPPVSADSAVEHYAMIGGRALLVARLTASHGWMVSYLDAEMAAAEYASRNAYLPVAVFDMTGDGYPELIFRENAGPVWGDAVLHKSTPRAIWKRAANSPGGSTI